jgi:hypothetical protein
MKLGTLVHTFRSKLVSRLALKKMLFPSIPIHYTTGCEAPKGYNFDNNYIVGFPGLHSRSSSLRMSWVCNKQEWTAYCMTRRQFRSLKIELWIASVHLLGKANKTSYILLPGCFEGVTTTDNRAGMILIRVVRWSNIGTHTCDEAFTQSYWFFPFLGAHSTAQASIVSVWARMILRAVHITSALRLFSIQ